MDFLRKCLKNNAIEAQQGQSGQGRMDGGPAGAGCARLHGECLPELKKPSQRPGSFMIDFEDTRFGELICKAG